jgi:tetratricopeptide (TPR) repeat protein
VSPRPPVFISAVTAELRSARQLVANTLMFLGYEPVWQDIFGTEGGDLREVLRKQIDKCNGVVQLVGKCYGAEPPQSDENFGRVSYTQYEALYGREQGKKVWYLFIDEHFPADPSDAEPDELQALQAAYRRRVQVDTHLFHPLTSREGLEMSVLKLRDDLTRLRRGVKQWAATVAILLVVSVALGIWLLRSQRQAAREIGETRQAVTAMSAEMSKLRRGIAEYPSVEAQVQQSRPGQDAAATQEQVYAELGRQLGIEPKLLRAKLPQLAKQLKGAPDATSYERANAAFVARDYDEAERLALQVAGEVQKAPTPKTSQAIQALELASLSAQRRIKYADAFRHLRDAEKLTDQQRGPAEWARVQHEIGQALVQQGKYAEAETAYRNAIKIRSAALGPENSQTLRSRVGLFTVLDFEGKPAAAETEARDVIRIQEKVLGKENPDTLAARSNLGFVLNKEGKHSEAETELRGVIDIQTKVLGRDHPDTLNSRHALASALLFQNKLQEAEAEYRSILDVRKKRLGPEHPMILMLRNNLAHVLDRKGDYAQAESELHDVVELGIKVLGPEHPHTLTFEDSLAATFREEQKFPEAEAEYRKVVAARTKVLGSEHPLTLESEYGLAFTLFHEQKITEAKEIVAKLRDLAPQAWRTGYPLRRELEKLDQNLQSQP